MTLPLAAVYSVHHSMVILNGGGESTVHTQRISIPVQTKIQTIRSSGGRGTQNGHQNEAHFIANYRANTQQRTGALGLLLFQTGPITQQHRTSPVTSIETVQPARRRPGSRV